MTAIRNLPMLVILPISKLLLHEHHDPQRTPPIMKSLRASGIIRNPPIVMPLHDRSGRYMVLDGANRVTAIDGMEIPHIVAQVVERDDPGIQLNPWNHVVWGIFPSRLYDSIKQIDEIDIHPETIGSAVAKLGESSMAAVLHLPDARIFSLWAKRSGILERNKQQNKVVNAYKQLAKMDRTVFRSMSPLQKLYPDLSGLVMFPHQRIVEVLYLAGEGELMPTGSTRFTISPRVLHINYPLDELETDKTLEQKNLDLQAWIRYRASQKSVRYYAEATYLFDE